jgi:biopolymer transport protein ExbD
MPKVKAARKSTHIDMTAMTDVAFLLLTFFMLTAKMKPNEPVTVDTPSSISETKLPDGNTIMILVDNTGKVYLDMAGSKTRYELIKSLNATHAMGLNETQQIAFANAGPFATSRAGLGRWLDTPPSERDKLNTGIPIDTADVNLNQLAAWIHGARTTQFELKQQGIVTDEYVVVVKADSNTPYPAIRRVVNTLKDINCNKFNLITNMEADPNKMAGAKGVK